MKKVRQQEAGFGSGKFPRIYEKCTPPLFFVLILSLKSKMYNLGLTPTIPRSFIDLCSQKRTNEHKLLNALAEEFGIFSIVGPTPLSKLNSGENSGEILGTPYLILDFVSHNS